MSPQVEYVIHQLFPAPAGLVVRYTLTWAARQIHEANMATEGIELESEEAYLPDELTLPVIAFATYDQTTQRLQRDGAPWGASHKVRGVEVLVYVNADAVHHAWPNKYDAEDLVDMGAVLLRQFDPLWSEPSKRPYSPYAFSGLFLNGLPYSG